MHVPWVLVDCGGDRVLRCDVEARACARLSCVNVCCHVLSGVDLACKIASSCFSVPLI